MNDSYSEAYKQRASGIAETKKIFLKKLQAHWDEVAQEPVVIHCAGEGSVIVYAMGSELACLRLFHHYKNGIVEHSETMGWFFRENKEFDLYKIKWVVMPDAI